MKTIKQHLEELPEPWRSEAMENARLAKSTRYKMPSLAEALISGFTWLPSKQGHNYWSSLHKILVSSPPKTTL